MDSALVCCPNFLLLHLLANRLSKTIYPNVKLSIDIMSEMSQNFKLLCKSQGMTQTELEERSLVSFCSIKRFERTGKVSLEALLRRVYSLGRLSDVHKIFEIDMDLKAVKKKI